MDYFSNRLLPLHVIRVAKRRFVGRFDKCAQKERSRRRGIKK
jgi:hypothetical protein